jgi:hypothetical protein
MENQLQVERLRQTSSTKSIRLPSRNKYKTKNYRFFFAFFMSFSSVTHIAIADVDVRKLTNEIFLYEQKNNYFTIY